ncbi:hypothetical protein [Cyanobium sp. NIES-981]|uniref:hypothetical protein n=1 Tax=Cyanobium sp. NIES-981 TaxID=1851505 RepID=UPI0007DDD2FC|nr:hypothetical protein [Cyanobium sp. NIES-981]SBO41839.1 conserved protein of unknown function [Cyanobium sp. NIES-981]
MAALNSLPRRRSAQQGPATCGDRLLGGLVIATVLLVPGTGLAQTESYLLGPGSSVGPSTKVKPMNCVTAPDGAITCDTELENPPGDTRARPQYELFNN